MLLPLCDALKNKNVFFTRLCQWNRTQCDWNKMKWVQIYILCVFWKMFQSLNYIAPHCFVLYSQQVTCECVAEGLFHPLHALTTYISSERRKITDNATQKITHIDLFVFMIFISICYSLFIRSNLCERGRMGWETRKKNRLDYVFVFLFAICGSWKNDGNNISYSMSHNSRHMCWHYTLYTIVQYYCIYIYLSLYLYTVRMVIDVRLPCSPTHTRTNQIIKIHP